jgi:hypothetical protein
MAQRLRHLVRTLSLVVVLTMLAGPGVLAQDASPEASPVASPVGAAEASPVAATCEPFTSPTAAEERAAVEAAFPIEQPANTEGSYVIGAVGDLQAINPAFIESEPVQHHRGLRLRGHRRQATQDGQPVAGGLTDYYEIAADCVTYTFHLQDRQDLARRDRRHRRRRRLQPRGAGRRVAREPVHRHLPRHVASWNVVDDDTIELVRHRAACRLPLQHPALHHPPPHLGERAALRVGDRPRHHRPGSGPRGRHRSVPVRELDPGPGDPASPERRLREAGVDRGHHHPPLHRYRGAVQRLPDRRARQHRRLPRNAAQVEADPETFSIASYPERGFFYYEFNIDPAVTTRFQDARVRQAFMWALDRQSIVDNILLGYGEVANGTQPSISYAYTPEGLDTTYTYDPARATALLTAAGWTDTNGDGTVDKDGVEMAFEFLYPSGSTTTDTLVAYLQDAWSQVGIGITPRGLEFPALIEATTTTPTFEVAFYGFNWDASFIQDVMFGCDQYQVGFNDMRYCNPELDALADQIEITLDQEARTALMIEYSNIVNEEQPVGILYFDEGITAWNNRLHNVFPSAWAARGSSTSGSKRPRAQASRPHRCGASLTGAPSGSAPAHAPLHGRRLLITIPLLVGVSFVTFALMNLIPGSPLQAIERNPKVRPADVARMKESYGLNDPWPQRYVEWLGNALTGTSAPPSTTASR